MTQFDQLLRRGLMDANLAQYDSVLRRADSAEPAFSPRYLRERMRLLADPWGWVRRRGRRGRKRLDWRLIAIAAALLLLSACAYAVVTGQFSQWFPRLGTDPQAPETSEEVLSRAGTVIEQSQTVDGVTVDLNAAVWDGDVLWLSLVLKGLDIPEEVAKGTHLYTEECTLIMPEEQWEEYVRKDLETHGGLSKELMEETFQKRMEEGQTSYWRFEGLYFYLLSREEDTLTFEGHISLADYVERPELTLHLEHIATYEDGEGNGVTWSGDERTGPGPKDTILEGPMDFTFTLGDPVLPIHYAANVDITLEGIPLRFTGFDISLRDMNTEYEVLAPVNEIHVSRPGEPEPEPDPEKLDHQDVTSAAMNGLLGLWTEDGAYVDLTGMPGGMTLITDPAGGPATGSAGRNLPHPVDPETVTALDIGGDRVELGGLERRDR